MKNRYDGFMDVALFDRPYSYVCYRSAGFVFEEGLVNGRWLALYYNAAGYIAGSNEIMRPIHMKPETTTAPEAFDIVVNGQSVNFDLTWEDTRIERTEERIVVHIIPKHAGPERRIPV